MDSEDKKEKKSILVSKGEARREGEMAGREKERRRGRGIWRMGKRENKEGIGKETRCRGIISFMADIAVDYVNW